MIPTAGRKHAGCISGFPLKTVTLFRYFRLWAILLLAGISGAAAQDPSPQESDLQKAFAAAINAATHGPADVPLRELATLHLPDSYSFIPIKEGAALMRAMGNSTDENLTGLIVSEQQHQNWFVIVDYRDSGHVKDDDAR